MRRIILVRHGESQINAVWKEKAIFCGQLDTPLTEKGRLQALDVGRLLADASQFRISHAVQDLSRSQLNACSCCRHAAIDPATINDSTRATARDARIQRTVARAFRGPREGRGLQRIPGVRK